MVLLVSAAVSRPSPTDSVLCSSARLILLLLCLSHCRRHQNAGHRAPFLPVSLCPNPPATSVASHCLRSLAWLLAGEWVSRVQGFRLDTEASPPVAAVASSLCLAWLGFRGLGFSG
uniref:Uncharacterized protein n=1 Tax=Opuntia streptacantha TaxID=393608 RepID=A0A7C9AE99_OPUST